MPAKLLVAIALSAVAAGCALDGQGTLDTSAAGSSGQGVGGGVGGVGGVAGGSTGGAGGSGGSSGADSGIGGGTVDDAGTDAPPPVDAAPDVVTGPCTTPAGACVAGVPAGWDLVSFAVDPGGGCPAGFSQVNKKANPTLGAGACDCTCSITTPPCVNGTSQTSYSYTSGGACGTSGSSLTISGTGCTPLGFTGNLANYYKGTPLPVGGACTGSAVTDQSKVVTQTGTVCTPPSACAEEVCTGQYPGAFGSCIQSPGDVACPAGPFVNKTLVMDDATLSCSTCPTCSVSATCANPKVAFFSNGGCTSSVTTVASDGTCVSVTGSGSVVAYKYLVDVQNPSCTATGAKQGQITAVAPTTVCCR